MKYDDARYLAPFFASLITVSSDWEADVLVPVPLHAKKLKKRGYNQSALIARALSKRLALPVDEGMLVRVRDTPSQTALHAAERGRNMKGAFEASERAAGKRVILVDDVRTDRCHDKRMRGGASPRGSAKDLCAHSSCAGT